MLEPVDAAGPSDPAGDYAPRLQAPFERRIKYHGVLCRYCAVLHLCRVTVILIIPALCWPHSRLPHAAGHVGGPPEHCIVWRARLLDPGRNLHECSLQQRSIACDMMHFVMQ